MAGSTPLTPTAPGGRFTLSRCCEAMATTTLRCEARAGTRLRAGRPVCPNHARASQVVFVDGAIDGVPRVRKR